MADSKPKAYSSPLPLRAIGDHQLAGLDLRVLACIAAHDRMSMKLGAGRGCYASHETLAAIVGCNYINLGKSIKKLGGLGYVLAEPNPDDRRSHIYRVPADLYDQAESLSFHQPSAEARARVAVREVGQSANEAAEIVCHGVDENQGKASASPSQYIPLNGERYSVETAKHTPLEEARLSSRADHSGSDSPDASGASEAPMLGKVERGTSIGAQQAIFERALKAGAFQGKDNLLLEWIGWLEEVSENHGSDEPEGGRARRLNEEAIGLLSDDAFRRWQEEGAPRLVLPVEAMVGEPGEIRAQVAAFCATVNRAGRDALATRCGLTPRELRAFAEGRELLPIGKQMALRAQVRSMAA